MMLLAWISSGAAAPLGAAVDPVAVAVTRENRLPRKVLVGSIVSGYGISELSLARRLDKMDAFVDSIAAAANSTYPSKRLDLVVLPEYLLAHPGETAAQQAVTLEEIKPRLAACATRHGCYLVAPSVLREVGSPARYSNAAILVGRSGAVVGLYRKVHPVAPQNSTLLEGGLTPGTERPVFDCDFGKLGIQICFDMLYPDGWEALAQAGAEIVALPSASPETAHPSMYALQHGYYIVSATPRDHAAVYGPLGVIEAQATKEGEVLVHEIDLSFAIVHWDAALEEGAALRRRFGNKVGFNYYRPEDAGLFWSNDPTMPVGRMLAALGLHDRESELRRLRGVQDGARGRPVSDPAGEPLKDR